MAQDVFAVSIGAVVHLWGVDRALVNVGHFGHSLKWQKRPTFANWAQNNIKRPMVALNPWDVREGDHLYNKPFYRTVHLARALKPSRFNSIQINLILKHGEAREITLDI